MAKCDGMELKDVWACGAGKEEKCCIFILAGPNGIYCGRGTTLEATLRIRRPMMVAQRVPEEPYPLCLLDEPKFTVWPPSNIQPEGSELH